MSHSRDEGFEHYVRERRGPLLRSATALAGGDHHLAEDLVQMTLIRLYAVWRRSRRNTDAYARRILVNLLIDERRRPARREQSWAQLPETAVIDPPGPADEALFEALAGLPPRMRAAVVLRHVEGLSVEETADALGCSAGNVKSQTARGLDKLRNWTEAGDADMTDKDKTDTEGANLPCRN